MCNFQGLLGLGRIVALSASRLTWFLGYPGHCGGGGTSSGSFEGRIRLFTWGWIGVFMSQLSKLYSTRTSSPFLQLQPTSSSFHLSGSLEQYWRCPCCWRWNELTRIAGWSAPQCYRGRSTCRPIGPGGGSTTLKVLAVGSLSCFVVGRRSSLCGRFLRCSRFLKRG